MVAQERISNTSFSDLYQEPVEMVKEYPLSSMMVLFGVGMGVGLILSHTLSESMTSRESYASSIFGDRLTKQFEESVSHILPDVLARYMKS